MFDLNDLPNVADDDIPRVRDELVTECRALLERQQGDTLSQADEERYNKITTGLDTLRQRHERAERLKRLAADQANVQSGVSFDSERQRDNEDHSLRSAAMRCLDRAVHDDTMPGWAAERVQRLMDDPSYESRDRAQQWAAAVGDVAYERAFLKVIGDPVRGHTAWTPEEQAAYNKVRHIRAALSLGAGTGAELVPLTLDPTVMLASDGSISPLRRIARVVQTATNTWQGVSSLGATAEWKPEGSEAGSGEPAFESPVVPVFLGDVDVCYSYEISDDAANFLPELQRVMVDAADQLQATAFTTGAGTTEPTGLVTALDAASPSLVVTGDGSEALMSSDVFKLQNALPPRWSPRAQWMASLGVINAIRQFESSNGSVLFGELSNGQLLGRAMNENSGMLAAPAVSATQDNYLAIYGDFSGFVIADRIGTTLEILPGYGAAAHRPTAQRHAFMTFRTGSNLTVPSFRMLNVPTTA